MKYYIGLDNGGTVIKACVFDEEGRQVSVERQKIDVLLPQDGFTERELLEVFEANVRAVRGAVEKAGVDKKDILSIGISGHGKGLYLLDKQGRELYRGIVSTDTRAIGVRKHFDETGVSERIYRENCQKVLESQPVCLLRWLKENDRETYDKIGYVLSVKDYIRYKLTGKIFAEYTDISGSNLINLRTGKKDLAQLEMFGIEEMYGCIPPIVQSFEDCGNLQKSVAEKLGLGGHVRVCGGMFDIDACALSVGIVDERDICVIAGTWSINEYISKTPVTGARSMNSFYCLPEYYLVEECSPTSAGNFEWFVKNLAKGKSYEEISEAVGALSVEESKAVFLPFLFASNEENTDLKGTFAYITARTGFAELARAVFEGVTFAHKRHVDKLLSVRGKPRTVRLTGGAANSKVWSQMFADVLGLTVETVADREHGCFGAGIAGAVCARIYPDLPTALAKTVKADMVYTPDGKKTEIYQKKYERYLRLVKAMDAFY